MGGLPLSAKSSDLMKLLGKLVPVTSVYTPDPAPTGVHRGFAIVEISATDKQLVKCLKTFNACHWKGSRLRFELAKQHYLDKLREEKAESLLENHSNQEIVPFAPLKKVATDGMLKLRCGMNKHMYIPTYSKSNKIIKFENSVDENVNQNNDSQSTTTSLDSPPKGGGKRLGFGTISENKERSTKESNDILKQPSENDTSRMFAPILEEKTSNTDNEYDNEMDSVDNDNVDSHEGDVSCVQPWELEDESLEKERLRQRSVMKMILSGNEIGENQSQKTDANPETETRMPPKKQWENINKWSVKSNMRFDPTACKENESILEVEGNRYEMSRDELLQRDGRAPEGISDSENQEKGKTADKSSYGEKSSNFADIDQLKGIFKGPDDDVESKRDSDNLFKEAEKIGIDVRDAASTSLSFNFFGDESTATTAANLVPSQPESDTSSAREMSAAERNSVDEENVSPKQKQSATLSLPSLAATFSLAYSFHREMSLADLNDYWRNSRDKLVVDYKRKSKEARKRKRVALSQVSKPTPSAGFMRNNNNKGTSRNRKIRHPAKKKAKS